MRYTAMVESSKACLSGICILYHEQKGMIRGSLFNEFGLSFIDFTYYVNKDRVKLHHVVKMMDKWYVRRVLRHDLRELLHALQQGRGEYADNRHRMRYQLQPMAEEHE